MSPRRLAAPASSLRISAYSADQHSKSSHEKTARHRHARHSRRAIARSFDRRDHDADLPDIDLRPAKSRETQGLRLLALDQSDPQRLRALHCQPGKRNARLGLRLRARGHGHGPRWARQRFARGGERRSLRRNLPAFRAGAAPLRESRFHFYRHDGSEKRSRRRCGQIRAWSGWRRRAIRSSS